MKFKKGKMTKRGRNFKPSYERPIERPKAVNPEYISEYIKENNLKGRKFIGIKITTTIC